MEVGKKYRSKATGNIYECLFVSPTDTVILKGFSARADPEFVLRQASADRNFVEYVEPPKPMVHTQYLTWLKNKSTGIVHVVSSDYPQATYSNNFIVLSREAVSFVEKPTT